MAKLAAYLLAVVLVVILDASVGYTGRYKNWNRLGGNHMGFGSDKCSALTGILPTPQSGCCGKHAGEGNDEGDGNNNDGGDQNDGNGIGDGDGNNIGGGDRNGDDYGNNDDDINNGDENNNIDGGDDYDNGNYDQGNGNNLGDDFDHIFDGMGMGNGWGFEGFRAKRSAEQNDSDTAPDQYITAGRPAGLRQYPWLVRLAIKVMEGFQTMSIGCGGSLISPRFVLTAAHCVDVNYQSYNDISIILAEYDTRTFPKDCVGSSCVKNIVMNPDKVMKHRRFDRNHLHNDIALMRLRGSAAYTDYIRPICLPPFNVDNPNNEGTPLSIAGWGSTGREASPIKLTAQVQLVPHKQCQRYYGDLTTGQVCASGRGGQDTCQGDSGGPLMTEKNGNFYVIGIVSGKSAETRCGSAFPTLYTNVFAYSKWIQQQMGNH